MEKIDFRLFHNSNEFCLSINIEAIKTDFPLDGFPPAKILVIREMSNPNKIVKMSFFLNGLITKVELESVFETSKQVKLLERNINGSIAIYLKNCKHLLPDSFEVNYYLDYYHNEVYENFELEQFIISEVNQLIKKIAASNYRSQQSIRFIDQANTFKDINHEIKVIIEKAAGLSYVELKKNEEFTRLYPTPISVLPPESRPDNNPIYSIFQITQGCWFKERGNPCKFCSSYNAVHYYEKDLDDLLIHIGAVKKFMGKGWPYVKKIFLADGDPLYTQKNSQQYFKVFLKAFPEINWYESFISTRTVLSKSIDEWKILAAMGLKKVYWGVESGDDFILKMLGKPHTSNMLLEAALILQQTGIEFVPIILAGLNPPGEDIVENNHVKQTAEIINKIDCNYIYISKLVISKDNLLPTLFQKNILQKLTDQEVEDQYRSLMASVQCEVRGAYGGQFVLETSNLDKLGIKHG